MEFNCSVTRVVMAHRCSLMTVTKVIFTSGQDFLKKQEGCLSKWVRAKKANKISSGHRLSALGTQKTIREQKTAEDATLVILTNQ